MPKYKTLRCDFVDAKPVNIDWRDALGDDCDGWTSYAWVECSCGHKFCAVGLSPYCDKCDEYSESADGPMMNYGYPIKVRDLEEAAKKIKDLPLCLVEMEDGTQYLALTGGGMDLSTEIIKAYIALGYLPPVHFRPADHCGWEHKRGMTTVLHYCHESAKCAAQWSQNHIRDIQEMRARQRRARKANKQTTQVA